MGALLKDSLYLNYRVSTQVFTMVYRILRICVFYFLGWVRYSPAMMTGLNEMMGLSGNARYGLSLTASAIRTEYAVLTAAVEQSLVVFSTSASEEVSVFFRKTTLDEAFAFLFRPSIHPFIRPLSFFFSFLSNYPHQGTHKKTGIEVVVPAHST